MLCFWSRTKGRQLSKWRGITPCGRRSCSGDLSFVRFHETDWLLSQKGSICERKQKPDNIVISVVYTHSCLYRHTFWAPATTLVVLRFLAIWLATEQFHCSNFMQVFMQDLEFGGARFGIGVEDMYWHAPTMGWSEGMSSQKTCEIALRLILRHSWDSHCHSLHWREHTFQFNWVTYLVLLLLCWNIVLVVYAYRLHLWLNSFSFRQHCIEHLLSIAVCRYRSWVCTQWRWRVSN